MTDILTCFIKDWKRIIFTAYSTWAIYVLAVLVNASDMLFSFTGIDTNPSVWTFWINMGLILAFVGRFIKQPKANNKRRKIITFALIFVLIAVASPVLAHPKSEQSFDNMAFSFVSKWEGTNKRYVTHQGVFDNWNVSYLDTIASPPLWTVCFGHTKTAGPGQYKTDKQCEVFLKEELNEYREGLHVYFSQLTKLERLPVARDVAYVSLAYNVGIRGAGKSTAVRRLNKGDVEGGCKAITWWNRAGKRIVRGLVRRRAKEYDYCMRGV